MSINVEEHKSRIAKFLEWFKSHCTGYEKGEGQIFFDRLFQAFGNAGVLEAGAFCEKPVKRRKSTNTAFVDLVWKPRVIIELKKRGTQLEKHYDQAFEYWLTLVPNRPQYMILCNFDEFWIFDLNIQLNDPVHVLKTSDLLNDWNALAFLFPKPEKPIFNNNNVEVTEEVAKIVGSLYLSLTSRKIDPDRAQRFVLQLVVALFAEDVDLIPKYTLYKILERAIKEPVSQKELTDLFTAMAVEKLKDKPSKYKAIPYFNGGIFREVEPVELNFKELDLLYEASKFNWSRVRPSIFGSIFEGSMDPKKRHGHGIHFTSELDIQKIVGPTIVRPFREKIEKAKSKKDLGKILKEITEFRVLDPACGSGNFLYIAFRELRRLEAEILLERGEDPRQIRISHVSPSNFFGIDTNHFAVELAKVSLSIGRKMSADELGLVDNVLPFEDLDKNFDDRDALLDAEWPDVDAIIGNPPFQSKNKMLSEFGQEYVNAVRSRYPEISGYADYCVYWFRKAHDHLKRGMRAGLVGTNTIRQNESRESGLAYIVRNSGTITDAVSSQVWSGDAVVHVSIVNWIKGQQEGEKKIFLQNGDSLDSPWVVKTVTKIPSNLSLNTDVTDAKPLVVNRDANICFQGQNHGHKGFLLSLEEGKKLALHGNEMVVHPFLTGDDLLGKKHGPNRYVIDFENFDLNSAAQFKEPFKIVEEKVLLWRENKAKAEREKNERIRKKNSKAKIDKQYANQLNKWWKLTRGREEMLNALSPLDRYIVCCRVTKRPIFEFVKSDIRPNGSLQVFALNDDYSFGILQSSIHWLWFTERCSTLKRDFRYTPETVFDSFPWPQEVSSSQVVEVAEAGRNIRTIRKKIMYESKASLREMYRLLEKPGKNSLRDAHQELDNKVRSLYRIEREDDALSKLLELNLEISEAMGTGVTSQGPGIPPCIKDPKTLISEDCIQIEVD